MVLAQKNPADGLQLIKVWPVALESELGVVGGLASCSNVRITNISNRSPNTPKLPPIRLQQPDAIAILAHKKPGTWPGGGGLIRISTSPPKSEALKTNNRRTDRQQG